MMEELEEQYPTLKYQQNSHL